MSYNKDVEQNKDVARQHNENLKKAASERLAKNAAWKKANKRKTTEKE